MLIGQRRVGKTTFIKYYLGLWKPEETLVLIGEEVSDTSLLQERSVANYSRLLAEKNSW